jgi:hypothetical protein
MKIGGAWVGWGLGDSSEEIRRYKAFMRAKFSYAKSLADTPDFDDATFTAVYQMQTAYTAQGRLRKPTGIIDYATKIASGYLAKPPAADTRPLLVTVCGTGVPWWVGPDADTARALESKYKWQPIGYRAAPVLMNTSVREGRDELCRQFEIHRDRVVKYGAAMIGYSQGAIVTSETWMQDMVPDNGRLHWARGSILKAVTFGNPMREQGRVWHDPGGPAAPLSSHGIADQLLTDTPTWWRDYAHKGDLYCDVEGESGENKTAIYKIIMGARMLQGPDSLLAQVLELGTGKPAELIGMLKAIMDAGLFFANGTGPHVNYSTRPAIEYLAA